MHDELDKELQCLTGNDWNSSHFSRAAEELSSINQDIIKAKDSKKTEAELKEQKEQERADREKGPVLVPDNQPKKLLRPLNRRFLS
ncbi:hypothetical protein BG003_001878, partial [Podila horticola]